MGKALVVQSDGSILVDVHDPDFQEIRSEIALFAELEKSPEHFHTYRMTPLSLWNAASLGVDFNKISEILAAYSRFPVPDNILFFIKDNLNKYGAVKLLPCHDNDRILFLEVNDAKLRAQIEATKQLSKYLLPEPGENNLFRMNFTLRGTVKIDLMEIGIPVDDQVPLNEGEPLEMSFRQQCLSGGDFALRHYQEDARNSLVGGRGFGTLVLPCGAGKTVIGMACMEKLQTKTLILAPNIAAVRQWIDELVDKTSLSRDQIGEYSGATKEIKDVTVATYQVLVWRPAPDADYPHFDLFRKNNWGLVIYDEVHLLPAPVFRVTAEIQAMRRVGLTATLVREDGREADVFSLVGPKRYDIPWKELEKQGFIAEAHCYEIRIPLPEKLELAYATADKRKKFRIASENPLKVETARQLIENHKDQQILVIGQYIDQLKIMAKELDAPLLTGATNNNKRDELYNKFRKGEIKVLVVSKVANFAIDLPDASVAIQISGTFGSRQEEAQRLGRILRPKEQNSFFYSLVSRYTQEEDYSLHRQQFLTEQGYRYHIELWKN